MQQFRLFPQTKHEVESKHFGQKEQKVWYHKTSCSKQGSKEAAFCVIYLLAKQKENLSHLMIEFWMTSKDKKKKTTSKSRSMWQVMSGIKPLSGREWTTCQAGNISLQFEESLDTFQLDVCVRMAFQVSATKEDFCTLTHKGKNSGWGFTMSSKKYAHEYRIHGWVAANYCSDLLTYCLR